MEEIEYLGEKIYRWSVGASTFLACPTRGARLMNWNVSYADGTFRDVIRWPQIEDTKQIVKARGGNPILFPFSARSFHQGEIHRWVDAQGQERPMPMHGFARQGTFELTRMDETGFAARLLPDEPAKEAYPYNYEFEVIYRFAEKQFSVEFRLENLDTQSIPWSAGHHFYFALPWSEDTTRADYQITIPAKKAASQNADGTLEAVKRFKKTENLDNPQLIDRIHYELSSPIVECICLKDDSKLEIEVGTAATPKPGYAIVTWTEDAKSPFFCIEPWMGPPNAAEHKIGLHQVAPNEIAAFSVTIRI